MMVGGASCKLLFRIQVLKAINCLTHMTKNIHTAHSFVLDEKLGKYLVITRNTEHGRYNIRIPSRVDAKLELKSYRISIMCNTY